MYLVRDIMYCKPGKVKPMIEKYAQLSKLSEQAGMGKMRVLTDVVGEQYWTIISEMEVESLDKFMSMDTGMDPELMKQMETIMKDYHEHIVSGRREVFKIEAESKSGHRRPRIVAAVKIGIHTSRINLSRRHTLLRRRLIPESIAKIPHFDR